MATNGHDPACDSGSVNNASAWWEWTAPSTGPVTFETIGSTFDTVLSVYTGATVGALAEVACDDEGGTGNTSLVTFQATAGTTYHLHVFGTASRVRFQGQVWTVGAAGPSTAVSVAMSCGSPVRMSWPRRTAMITKWLSTTSEASV